MTDADLIELAKTPEFRAEIAIKQAKSAVHLASLVAAAIRDAVRQDRTEVDELLAKRLENCFCSDGREVCDLCCEVARVRGLLTGRPER